MDSRPDDADLLRYEPFEPSERRMWRLERGDRYVECLVAGVRDRTFATTGYELRIFFGTNLQDTVFHVSQQAAKRDADGRLRELIQSGWMHADD